ncbi:type I methionyl aminopeptidase [Candidatus Berkelbacteria bacterium]|nr:type I methionyl aminopeptidase [Candidatus Berkelbacteria bacterium]
MKISIKSQEAIDAMRQAGSILAATRNLLIQNLTVGETSSHLDQLVENYICTQGAEPAFKGYKNFPASICFSVNDGLVHGLPNTTPIQAGDVIKLDFGIRYQGWNVDAATTVGLAPVSAENKRLIDTTKKALWAGIKKVQAGIHLGDVQAAIQEVIENANLGLVHSLTGHGIGRELHEPPSIPNHGERGTGPVLQAGMTICLEPMVTTGSSDVQVARDGWTYITSDGSYSAHEEHTILVTHSGFEILTL